jgi:UDP-2-acetamido-2,6-beta-L-arabino-hexul-4-ose reductase
MPTQEFHYEPVSLHQDARGIVLEPVSLETLRQQSNSHLVLTQPGEIRGNHWHPRGAEVTVILGPALVRVRLRDQTKDILVPEGEAYRFFFPAGVPHAMKNTGATPMILVAFNTEVHDPANPDVVRDSLL